MGGLADKAAYQTALATENLVPWYKPANAAGVGQHSSLWTRAGIPIAATIPGAAAVCTSATPGALVLRPRTTGKRAYLSTFLADHNIIQVSTSQELANTVHLYDRLIEAGGLSGALNTVQAVNTPTLPTRLNNANGTDVLAFLEVFATTTAAATVTVNYTDPTGAAQVTSVAINGPALARVFDIPPAAGAPPGFKSIESIQLSATGTAGNLGIVLAQRVAMFPAVGIRAPQHRVDAVNSCFAPIHDDACLWLVVDTANNQGYTQGGLFGFIEEP